MSGGQTAGRRTRTTSSRPITKFDTKARLTCEQTKKVHAPVKHILPAHAAARTSKQLGPGARTLLAAESSYHIWRVLPVHSLHVCSGNLKLKKWKPVGVFPRPLSPVWGSFHEAVCAPRREQSRERAIKHRRVGPCPLFPGVSV